MSFFKDPIPSRRVIDLYGIFSVLWMLAVMVGLLIYGLGVVIYKTLIERITDNNE